MTNFKLRGLAEGITGHSSVLALNSDKVFEKFPNLIKVSKKLNIKKNTIEGFVACDG